MGIAGTSKKELLRLLEEDGEFGYVAAAKIGLLKILEKLDSHNRKFNEILERLDRHEKILRKHTQMLEGSWQRYRCSDRSYFIKVCTG